MAATPRYAKFEANFGQASGENSTILQKNTLLASQHNPSPPTHRQIRANTEKYGQTQVI
jgi:hypothetical protein